MPHVYDTFNRADSTTSLGTSDSGHAWTANRGTWGISSNTAYQPTSGSPGAATVDLGAPNGALEVTCTAGTHEFGVFFRFTDYSNTYMVTGSNVLGLGKYGVYKRVSGTQTQIVLGTAVPTVGQRIRVAFVGDSIKLYVNGTLDIDLTDSSITTGNAVGLRTGSGTSVRFDDFDARPAPAPEPLSLSATANKPAPGVGARAALYVRGL